MNEYLKFYEKYKISPVVQDISNFEKHVKRRANLYRQLSVLPLTIKNKNILEVGPGGGYNALATYTFEPNTYTLIEPNTTGFNELNKNFKELKKRKNIFTYNCTFEEFETKDKFDIIICEGLIPGLNNKTNVIEKIGKLLNKNGIAIIITADQISIFFEIIRKYISNILTNNISNIEKKVEILVDAFTLHLDTLTGMTRSYEDWCLDNLIGDAIFEHTLNINQSIDILKEDFYVLGTSPDIFTNFSWYKQLNTNTIKYNRTYKDQFLSQWHNLIDFRHVNNYRDKKLNIELSKLCLELLENIKNKNSALNIINIIEKIKINLLYSINDETIKSIEEVILLLKEDITIEKVRNMANFKSAFGRGQIYISFEKA